jgi:hypothetical protein
VENFSETHKIRCYTIAEIKEHLSRNGFAVVSAYDWDDKMKMRMPRKQTFRTLVIGKKGL